MSTLVFDIETVGEHWDSLDDVTQSVLSRWIERTAVTEEVHKAQLRDLKEGLGFSPLTGKIVALGVYDIERGQGAVYYTGKGDESDEMYEGYILKQCSETEMLQDFWEGAFAYDTFVTFNGRSFDVPFLLHRSVVCGVVPTRNLLEGRYLYQQKSVRHIDLQDQLTFYGAMMRKPSLHMFCRAYGIQSPKAGGVAGDDVAALFAEESYKTIAKYNARDVQATTALYEKWNSYLAPHVFDNE